MTRIAKLYRKLLEGRSITFAEFEKLLGAFGYVKVGQRGSHIAWRHSPSGDKRIIQPKGKDAKRYQVEQFLDMVEKLALKLDENDDPSIPH